MRIAVFSDMVRPNGAGVMALLAADLLDQAGHEVVVLGGAIHAGLEAQLQRDLAGAAAFTNDEAALDGSVSRLAHEALLEAFRGWFDAQLESYQPDILYIHNCGRVLSQLDVADLSRRLPVVLTMHDEWFSTDAHYTFRSRKDGAMVRTYEPIRSTHPLIHRYDHLFDVADRSGNLVVLAPSAWLADRARLVFPTLDIRHLPNAVDASLFDLQDRAEARARLGIATDRPIIGFVGNPTQERKGFAEFESAVQLLDSTGDSSPIRLVAGGPGSMTTGMAHALLDSGPIDRLMSVPKVVPPQVSIGGDGIVVSGLARSEMAAFYGAADVIVHPSIIDNLPTVPIEAGLCGTRCLATDVGGTRETIADIDDLFPADFSSADLAARIGTALDSASAETADDRNSRRDAQLGRFSVDEHVTALLGVLTELMAGAS